MNLSAENNEAEVIKVVQVLAVTPLSKIDQIVRRANCRFYVNEISETIVPPSTFRFAQGEIRKRLLINYRLDVFVDFFLSCDRGTS